MRAKKKKERETNSKPLVCKISSEKKMLDLTWWSSSKESACQCRGHRFQPWSRKIGRAGGAAKPSCHSHWGLHTLEPVLCNERSHHDGQPELHKLERACEQQQTPSAAKINKQIKLKYWVYKNMDQLNSWGNFKKYICSLREWRGSSNRFNHRPWAVYFSCFNCGKQI